MKIRPLILLVLLLYLFPLVNAVSMSEESSSVSRIVGESSSELLSQMQKTEIDLNHATYFTHDQWNNKKESILEKQFGSDAYTDKWFWNFEDISNNVYNFDNNELFILETKGGSLYSDMNPTIYPSDMKSWQQSFEENNPLFVFDSPYGGAYLPKKDSFVSRLVRDSTIIAPSSFNSPEFTRSFLCKLMDKKTIGQVFREARNFHYGSSKTSFDNYIGVVLQSYALYGNPRQEIVMEWKEKDYKEIKDRFCKNDLDNLAPSIEFLENIGNYSKFRKHVVFEIPSVNVIDAGNFSIINATPAFQNYEYDEVVLPIAVRTTHFPKDTIITNFSLDYVGDHADLEIKDLPSFENGLVKRRCYNDYENYSVIFSDHYTKSDHDFIAKINPVEVINCTQGQLRIYRKFNYSVDYIARSPALIENIDAPFHRNINEVINVSMSLTKLTNDIRNISIGIFNQDRGVYHSELNSSLDTHHASFYAPQNEGLNTYSAEIIHENQTTYYKEFSVYTTILEPRANIPISADSDIDIDIEFLSHHNQEFELKGKYYLMHDDSIVDEGKFSQNMVKGINLGRFSFSGLQKEYQSYTLILELNYLNQEKTITYLINTNNVPIILTEHKKNYDETDQVTINFTTIDYDEDIINITINDSRFMKTGNSYSWQTSYYDAGNYSVKIYADDGYIVAEKAVSFEIDDVIPPANFYGNAIYDNGSYVSDNLDVEAYINNTFVASAFTKNSGYNITIPADNPETEWKEGGIEGDLVKIFVDGHETNSSWVWEQGIKSRNDLEVFVPLKFKIGLNKGWNLISIPLKLDDYTLQNSLKGIEGYYSDIFIYSNNEWHRPVNDTINETRAFWINMLEKNTLTIQGKKILNFKFDLKKGWNLVGYPSIKANLINQTINDSQISSIFAYNDTKWSSFNPNGSKNDLEWFVPGYGYWIKMK